MFIFVTFRAKNKWPYFNQFQYTAGVFSQVTWRQRFDAVPGTDWTIFMTLSIGHHVKLDACASKF